ncbi:Uncharacterised protein [Achromobacter xylosoxidans]|nr:Uncharacterised protein [Achromobacter xylosoxidans]
MPVELLVPAGRLAPRGTGRPRRRTGLRRPGHHRRVQPGRRGARPHGSQDPEAAAHHRRHLPAARRPRGRATGPDLAGADPRGLRQPVRTHHPGPHPRAQGRIPAGARGPHPSAAGLRTPAPPARMPGDPVARLRRRPRPHGAAGALAGRHLPAPRLGRPDPAVPLARRPAPRRRRPRRPRRRPAGGGAGPGADARALAQAAARHPDRHPHPPVRVAMRLRAVGQRRTAPAHPHAAGQPVSARSAGADPGGGAALRLLAGRAALRIPRRDHPARPHARHLPAPGNPGRRRAALSGRNAGLRHRADRKRTGADRRPALRGLLPHGLRHRAVRPQQRHPVPGPRLGRQLGRVLLPGHHRGRSAPRQQPVRTLHQQGTQRAARHRRRLRTPAARGRDPVHLPQVRPPARRPDRRGDLLPAAQRAARHRPRAGRGPGRDRRRGARPPVVGRQEGNAAHAGRLRA